MAARQQPRGTGLEVQYKDFVPKSDWKDQPEAILFTIDLPGFTKEQIKVMYVHASTMIRVTGERPLAGRKWSRFNKVFTVPQNCLANKIHGSFNNNTLTITMPKETITKMPNLPETSKTMADKVEKLEEKRLLEESTRKEKEAEAEKKKKKLLEEKEGILRKLQEEAKAKEMAEAKKLQEEAVAKEKAGTKRMQEEAIAKEKAEARRLQEEAKAREMVEARRLQEEVIAKEKAEARRLQEEAKAKEMAEAKRLQKAAISKEKLLEEAALEKKIQDKKSMDEFVRKEKMKEKLSYSVLEENKTGKGIMEKIRGREITSEEKKLMMDVGVSAFVIFALGAYVSYRPE